MDNLDLSDFFKTKEAAIDFSSRLAKIAEKIFETDFNVEKAVAEQFGIQKKDKFMILLHTSQVNTTSNTTLSDFFTKLQQRISQIPVVSLTIAFEPREETLNVLSEWFMLNIKTQFLFDISVNPKLIGGASIFSNGKYIDFSIKPVFDRVITQLLAPSSASSPNRDKPAPEAQQIPVIPTKPVVLPDHHQSIESMSLGR